MPIAGAWITPSITRTSLSLTDVDSAFTKSVALVRAPARTQEAAPDLLLAPGLVHEAAADPTLVGATIAPDPALGLGPEIADPGLGALRNLVLVRTRETGTTTTEASFSRQGLTNNFSPLLCFCCNNLLQILLLFSHLLFKPISLYFCKWAFSII